MRGPLALPGPLSPRGIPVHRTPRDRFDLIVADVLAALEPIFAAEPDPVDVVVEEVPLLPRSWDDDVPLSAAVQTAHGGRVVLYRLPIRGRCHGDDLVAAVWQLVLDRLAEIWRLSPDDIDPRLR